MQVPLGNRPSLIRTDAADPADVLHADGATDQRTASRQAVHADAKKKCEHHRKFLWQSSCRHCDRADGRVQPPVSLAQADDAQHGAEDERDRGERDDQTLDCPLERGSRLRAAFGRPDNLSIDALATSEPDHRVPGNPQSGRLESVERFRPVRPLTNDHNRHCPPVDRHAGRRGGGPRAPVVRTCRRSCGAIRGHSYVHDARSGGRIHRMAVDRWRHSDQR